MLVKKYRSEIVSIQNPFDGIFRLEFKSHAGRFKYDPGQFLHLAIDQDYDGIGQWPESRCFSIHSNPDETTIKVTYAIKGRFTKWMEQQLRVGSEVWLKLPYGDLFSQNHNKENTVFIAGGTGITPFLSLFTHKSFHNYTNPSIFLGFKSKSYNIYDAELNQISNCKTEIYYEDANGLIDINKILSECTNAASYFISGPPAMIKFFKHTLSAKGVPAHHIHTDDWE